LLVHSDRQRLKGSTFKASPSKKLARPHLNKVSLVLWYIFIIPAMWEE
jgi:hypothetical protein